MTEIWNALITPVGIQVTNNRGVTLSVGYASVTWNPPAATLRYLWSTPHHTTGWDKLANSWRSHSATGYVGARHFPPCANQGDHTALQSNILCTYFLPSIFPWQNPQSCFLGLAHATVHFVAAASETRYSETETCNLRHTAKQVTDEPALVPLKLQNALNINVQCQEKNPSVQLCTIYTWLSADTEQAFRMTGLRPHNLQTHLCHCLRIRYSHLRCVRVWFSRHAR